MHDATAAALAVLVTTAWGRCVFDMLSETLRFIAMLLGLSAPATVKRLPIRLKSLDCDGGIALVDAMEGANCPRTRRAQLACSAVPLSGG